MKLAGWLLDRLFDLASLLLLSPTERRDLPPKAPTPRYKAPEPRPKGDNVQ